MALDPRSLQTPERSLRLETRGVGSAEELAGFACRLQAARSLRPSRVMACRDCWRQGRDATLRHLEGSGLPRGEIPGTLVQQLAHLRGRIESARSLRPLGSEPHWVECWRAGRDDVLRAVEFG